ncbi:MAG: C4-dicarboxylate ABC transporter permease [Nitrospinae bacterium CG11_big_fil_rev_8_21_14_0_20_56_8]|nr:MAG: C4-dicarboxylate ABC transporter permease [Nitrospinae bacterium CG11_big_fil_rev_8_21_14_0_20_56_8]
MKTIQKVEDWIGRIESWLVLVVLLTMIVLSFGQVILRNVFNSGILWADIFLRQMVLWVGFLGASLATRENRHISIDLLPILLPRRWHPPLRALTHFAAGIISGFLAHAAWRFVEFEREAESVLFLNFPVWWFQLILPYGMVIISLRCLLNGISTLFPPNPSGAS